MALNMIALAPKHSSYDLVIVGGAIMGSSAAWFLTENPDFDGRILVVERDTSYENCSTAHTNSCIRQQFSTELNVKISQFTAEFVKNLREYMGGDKRVPELSIHNFGYLYLADNHQSAEILRQNQIVQHKAGAATKLLPVEDIKQNYPFFQLDDIILGSINTADEGYWDGFTVFDWFRRSARARGVEYIANEVVGMNKSTDGRAVESVVLKSGQEVSCGLVLNASGPRASKTAQMAGIEVPVEPRKRFTWIFSAEQPLDRELPLTIDPSGVHVRELGGGTYQCGGHTADDPRVDYTDFEMDHDLWQSHIWPVIASRIPQFEAIRVTHEWAGHYAYNTFDQNAIIGPHSDITNFYFLNGFSGHGLQQSPAMGRATAEFITYGEFRSLDMSPFRYERIANNEPVIEQAII